MATGCYRLLGLARTSSHAWHCVGASFRIPEIQVLRHGSLFLRDDWWTTQFASQFAAVRHEAIKDVTLKRPEHVANFAGKRELALGSLGISQLVHDGLESGTNRQQ